MEFARTVIDALDASELDYLIGGAVAVWAWGELRTTRDLDVVVNLPGTRIVQLSEELNKRKMLVPAEIIIDLLIQPEGDLPINAIHLDTGYKAELFLLRDGDVYREISLSRRRLVDFGPPLGNVYVHSPEDLILNKIHYFSLSQQDKHVHDIASIMVLMDRELDRDYINQWVERLKLSEIWLEMQRRIQDVINDLT
ncbi:MAG: hypothetical protein AAF702_20960 [Chloroflexota bacterium]